MSRRNAMLFVLALASLTTATYAASCHCGPPASDGRGATQTPQAASAPAATPEPRASASGAQGGSEAVPPLGAPILRRAS
ncbi:MAG: hypothetical protein HY897_13530 [Deltaproteobacteria bacterium]|nr:hypothetical protein [Deltaproteobacteria bacterium]